MPKRRFSETKPEIIDYTPLAYDKICVRQQRDEIESWLLVRDIAEIVQSYLGDQFHFEFIKMDLTEKIIYSSILLNVNDATYCSDQTAVISSFKNVHVRIYNNSHT